MFPIVLRSCGLRVVDVCDCSKELWMCLTVLRRVVDVSDCSKESC